MARILVVDDDNSLLNFLRMILGEARHDVRTASNGVEALMLYSTYRSSIDVVVTDILMPGMNGVELAARLRALNPALPILLMTGFVPDEITVPGDLQVLSKPFPPSRLIEAIEQTLTVRSTKESC